MEEGWFKIYRKLKHWRWRHKPEYVSFLFHCLLFANLEDYTFEFETIKRGSFVTSIADLSREIGISARTVRTILKNLEKSGFLTVKAGNRYTIVSISNYDLYQGNAQKSDKLTTSATAFNTDSYGTIENKSDKPTTSQRQASDKPATSQRQASDKNIRNKNKEDKNKEDFLGTDVPLSPEGDGVSDTTPEIPENGEKTDAADNTLTLTPPTAEAEKKKSCAKRKKDDAIDFDALKEFFNNTMQGRGIHQITSITGKRQQAVAARAREHGKNAIATVIENAAKSKFLNAETPENFLADFNWLFRPENFVKVLEGKYTNRDRAPMQQRPAKLSGAGAALAAYEELQQKYEQQNGNNNADTDNGNGSHSTDAATDYLLTLNGF